MRPHKGRQLTQHLLLHAPAHNQFVSVLGEGLNSESAPREYSIPRASAYAAVKASRSQKASRVKRLTSKLHSSASLPLSSALAAQRKTRVDRVRV